MAHQVFVELGVGPAAFLAAVGRGLQGHVGGGRFGVLGQIAVQLDWAEAPWPVLVATAWLERTAAEAFVSLERFP